MRIDSNKKPKKCSPESIYHGESILSVKVYFCSSFIWIRLGFFIDQVLEVR